MRGYMRENQVALVKNKKANLILMNLEEQHQNSIIIIFNKHKKVVINNRENNQIKRIWKNIQKNQKI